MRARTFVAAAFGTIALLGTAACTAPPARSPAAAHAPLAPPGAAPAAPSRPAPELDDAASRALLAHVEAERAIAVRDFAAAERAIARAVERDGMLDTLAVDLAHVRVEAVLAAARPTAAAFDLAAKACELALAAAPSSARAFALRGVLAMKERRFAAARDDFERALTLAPSSAAIRKHRADLAASLHDFASAESMYREVLAADPTDQDARIGRAVALRARLDGAPDADYEERYRAARDAIASAINAAPERPDGYYHFAVLLLDGSPRRGEPRAGGELTLLLALEMLNIAIEKAGHRAEYSDLARRAKEHIDDIRAATVCDFRGEAERRRQQTEAKDAAAREEAEAADALAP